MVETRTKSRRLGVALVASLALLLPAPRAACAALGADLQKQLAESKYVYIQSQRKDGSFSKPAEIWFFLHEGAVYVGSKKTTWRVRRIQAGHREAKIHLSNGTGPSFDATGEIVNDPARWKRLFEAYAKKYPDGWSRYEKNFREGAANGSYALIKYTPK